MTVAPEQRSSYLNHRQILVVLGGLLAGVFLAALDMSIVGTALPRIVSDLGGLQLLSWVVTAYLLTSTASTPLWGKISDLSGRRPMFQLSIGVFVTGSVIAALAPTMTVLIAGRAVQGLGAGGLMALALATIGDIIPPRERGRYQGYFGAVFGTSSIAGPLLGGFFTDGPGWRWIFWINVPIGLAALIVTSRALRRAPAIRRDHKIDYLGAAVVVAAVSSILLYTAWAGHEFGYTAPISLALLGGGVLLTVLFVFVEARAEEPIIPLRLFRNRVFTPTVAFTMLMGLAMFGGMVTMTGVILMIQNLFDLYATWAYAWALIAPTSMGLAKLLYGALRGLGDEVKNGLAMAGVGAVIFLVAGAFFELVIDLNGFGLNVSWLCWPALLIGGGIITLIVNLIPRGNSSSE